MGNTSSSSSSSSSSYSRSYKTYLKRLEEWEKTCAAMETHEGSLAYMARPRPGDLCLYECQGCASLLETPLRGLWHCNCSAIMLALGCPLFCCLSCANKRCGLDLDLEPGARRQGGGRGGGTRDDQRTNEVDLARACGPCVVVMDCLLLCSGHHMGMTFE